MTSGRTALVLAAGLGSRQDAEGSSVPKPLIPVAGRPLILRTLDSIQLAGCTRTVIVLGHRREEVQRAVRGSYRGPLSVDFVENPQYLKGNGLSVLAARAHLPGEFMLVMADHVFSREIMLALSRATRPDGTGLLAVDFKLSTVFDIDDATKVLVGEDGGIRSIGKGLTRYNAVDCGVFLLGDSFLRALERLETADDDASVTAAVQELSRDGQMRTLDVGDAWWQDVDDGAMLAEAERRLDSISKNRTRVQ